MARKSKVIHWRTWNNHWHSSACGKAGWRRNDVKKQKDATCKLCLKSLKEV